MTKTKISSGVFVAGIEVSESEKTKASLIENEAMSDATFQSEPNELFENPYRFETQKPWMEEVYSSAFIKETDHLKTLEDFFEEEPPTCG